MLDSTIVNVAIPRMIVGLHTSLDSATWVNSSYLLAFAFPLLLTGRLGDHVGRKAMFIAGMVIFTAASIGCGVSPSAGVLIAMRAVQGLGAATMAPQTMAFITYLFPQGKRGLALGVWGAAGGLATTIGPLLGGVLVENLSWRWIFIVNVPIGVVGLVLAWLLVPSGQERHTRRFDILGTVLSSLGLLALIFGIQNGEYYRWGHIAGRLTITETFGIGIILITAFVVWQRLNRSEPLIPLTIFRNRNFSLASTAGFCVGFALTALYLPVAIYLQSVLGRSPLMAGVVTMPIALTAGLVMPYTGRLSDRITGKYVVLAGFAIFAAGMSIIVLGITPQGSVWTVALALGVCGVGTGSIFSPLVNVATTDVPQPMMGAASGVYNMTRQLGSVVGSAATSVLLQAQLAATGQAATVAHSHVLPARFRGEFIAASSKAAAMATASASPGHVTVPPGAPASVGSQFTDQAVLVFRESFTNATQTALLLPVAVLLLGLLTCLAMTSRSRSRSKPAPDHNADKHNLGAPATSSLC
jgi:EmrB/QacA subfamily drug resistance transporter